MSNLITMFVGNLGTLSENELRQINSLAVAELRHRQDKKVQIVKSSFNVGDKVKFQSKYGTQVGVINRFKQKTVEVQVGLTRWTVTATLLSKA